LADPDWPRVASLGLTGTLAAPFGTAAAAETEGAAASSAAIGVAVLASGAAAIMPTTVMAPIPNPTTIERRAIRNSRRKRGAGANQPNSGWT
jgi:hypothetical protein